MAHGHADYGLLTIPDVLQNTVFETVTGDSGILSVDHSIVPATKFRYYLSAAMQHSEGGISHLCTILELDGSNNQVSLLTSGSILGTAGALPVFALGRSQIVPPGHHLRFQLDALTAGNTLLAKAIYVELDFTHEIPNL